MSVLASPAAVTAGRRRPAAFPRPARPIGRREAAVVLLALLVVAGMLLRAAPAGAQTPGPCREGDLPGGARSLICVPVSGWNGDLVLFAHGYVAPGGTLRFPHLTLHGGALLPEVVQRAGYAFATTSYRRNGLAVLEGIQDLRELRTAFATRTGTPGKVLATGVSEGGLVVTLLAERHPGDIDGTLAACAPLSGLRRQVDHIGDVRVLFDFFFPGVLPGHPARVPDRVRRNWRTVFRPRVRSAVLRRRDVARRLIRTARIAVDARDRRAVADAVVNILWFNVHATEDLSTRLGGNPYDNTRRRYSGSGQDRRLNRRVRRIRSSSIARAKLAAYEPSGALAIPLAAMHTTGDEVVPVAHQSDYARRVRRAGAADQLITRRVRRYGHCEFRVDEVLGVFDDLVARVGSTR